MKRLNEDVYLFGQVKIRGRSLQCEVCGEIAAFTRQDFLDFDYEKFTQSLMSTVFSLLFSLSLTLNCNIF